MSRSGTRWLYIIVLAITWGSSFILIKKSLEVFSPYQIGSVRVGLSGLLFLWIGFPAMRAMNRSTFLWMVLTGALGNFIPMYLFPLAQTKVTSSMAGILDSLVPIFVLIFGLTFFRIRSSLVQWAGAICGFAGAGLLMYFSGGNDTGSDPLYAMLVVLATACYALSALIINRKLRHVNSIQLSASVFSFWMVPSLLIFVFSDLSGLCQNPKVWSGFGYLLILSLFGTALAILLYFRLIQTTSAVFASMVTYLLPVVAVFWGLLAGEHFTVWYAVGGVLILLGIYMVQENDGAAPDVDDTGDQP